jgi:hypothetical protein
MVEKLNFFPLQVANAIKRISIWWGSNFRGLEFGLSIPRTQKLYKSKLYTLRDLQKAETKHFHSWDELKILFPLEKRNIVVEKQLINSLLECWIKELKQPNLSSCDGEWLGLHNDETTSNPTEVFVIA